MLALLGMSLVVVAGIWPLGWVMWLLKQWEVHAAVPPRCDVNAPPKLSAQHLLCVSFEES